jgi:hypothetical protein
MPPTAPVSWIPSGHLLSDLGGRCCVFASCGADEFSYEDPMGLEAGVFGYFLAQGLEGSADKDGNGVVALSEVLEYVEEQVQGWCRRALQPGTKPQRPRRFPQNWSDDLPLASTPLWGRIEEAKAALQRLGGQLNAAEQREAATALASPADRALLAEWLIKLDGETGRPGDGGAKETASRPVAPSPGRLVAGPPLVTLEAYRTYRRVLAEKPQSLRANLYRLLPPRQALIAMAHLPPSEDPTQQDADGRTWYLLAKRLARGELSVNDFLDWMENWLQVEEPTRQRETGAASRPAESRPGGDRERIVIER